MFALTLWAKPDVQSAWLSHVTAVRSDEEVAQLILAYLAEHPQAMDTAEGVADWWLMREQVRVSTATVTRALRRLVERGLLEEFGEGEQRRYRLKR
jgi:Fic family protein